jgi:hypothetical protein
VARHRGFRRAAGALGVTTSVIQAVRALEARVGARLLRGRRRPIAAFVTHGGVKAPATVRLSGALADWVGGKVPPLRREPCHGGAIPQIYPFGE